MRRGCARLAAVASCAAALLAPASAGAGELRQIEAVGSVGLVPGEPPTTPPRDAALRVALLDAVRRVALDVSGNEESPEVDARLRAALGEDPLKYTTRFRILEDRGERPALFSEQPGVETEYVVVVDALVDVERVRQSLARSGRFSLPSGEGSRVHLKVAVELSAGAQGYAAYAGLQKALLGIRGVRSAAPSELERGRAVLAVEADRPASALLDELLREAPPGLSITPLAAESDDLALRVEWMPSAAAPLSDAIDTRTPKRY